MAEQDDKPGMGVSGAAAGVVGLGVGGFGVAGIDHMRRKGHLTDEAKKQLGERHTKGEAGKTAFKDSRKGDGAAKAYAEVELPAEIAVIEQKALEAAKSSDAAIAAHLADPANHQAIYEAAINAEVAKKSAEATEAFKKAHPEAAKFDARAYAETHRATKPTLADELALLTNEEAHARALTITAGEAQITAEETFKAANKEVAKYAESVAAKAKDVTAKAVEAAGKDHPGIAAYLKDKTKHDAIFEGGAEHAAKKAIKDTESNLASAFKAEHAKKITEDAAKKFKDAATKPEGIANEAEAVSKAFKDEFARIAKVKDAKWYAKPGQAFMAMGTGGKALSIGVGAVLGLGALMAIKSSRQNAWQEQINDQRAATAQQPAR